MYKYVLFIYIVGIKSRRSFICKVIFAHGANFFSISIITRLKNRSDHFHFENLLFNFIFTLSDRLKNPKLYKYIYDFLLIISLNE